VGADVKACPSARVLERLLAEELAGADRDSVEAHVEYCADCQRQLDEFVTATSPAPVSSGAGSGDTGSEPAAGFLARIRELMPPNMGRSSASGDGPEGGSRLGPYEILGKLGQGGMGTVYRARHSELGKVVALKVLPADQVNEVRVARFKKEVRAIGRLNHPNVVVAYDAGEDRGVHFLVMELVDGQDLARVIARHGRLGIADACEAVRQTAVALQHAFEQGLVHRDVKPNNLMLDRDGRVRLLDLGLARASGEAAGDALTAQGVVVGTADYLAPEQWDRPQAADTRADVYSLGCTLYHALAGRPPFGDYGSLPQKMVAHLRTKPPPIEQFCPGAPPGLAAVLARMLAKDPAGRFATPGNVAEALKYFSAGAALGRLVDAAGPINAADAATPVPGAWETNRDRGGRSRPVRRRRAVAVLAAVGLLAVAAAWLWLPRIPGPPQPLAVTDLRVRHYRDSGKTFVGDLRTSAAAVRLNDNVEVLAALNRPAFYYLIALNPQGSKAGTVQLCQPENASGEGAEDVPPGLRNEVHYPRDSPDPRDSHDFFVDAVGLQAFVLVASTRPLPRYGEWRTRIRQIPWEGRKDVGTWRWWFDGRTFTRFPRERGRIEPREGVPEPLQRVREFFAGRPEFDVVQIIAFPVADDPK
jgi:hypothetical protein